MPIPDDSPEWEEASSGPRLHNRILEFLRQNPNQVYFDRELADELLETDWEAGRERERLRNELSEEEFEERRQNDNLPGTDRSPMVDAIRMCALDDALSRLIDNNQIEQRVVDASAFDLPYDWETVTGFTYNNEGFEL